MKTLVIEPVGRWIVHYGYQEIVGNECSITLEARPSYCDRGRWLAKVFPRASFSSEIDGQDGWPRYYFDENRAKLEIEAWLRKRGQFKI